MNEHTLITLSHVSAAYDRKIVLRDINLTIGKRDFWGILGPNGGGKTTLIKLLLGLLEPTKGERQCTPSLRMGYLPQYNALDKKFPISVEEVILSGLSGSKPMLRQFTNEQREKTKRTITRMGLDGLQHRPIGALSGGQLQRVLLGRALVGEPQLLILDEPNTYIDQVFEAQLYELLHGINTDCAIVLAGHDTDAIRRHAKTIAFVHETLSVEQ
ncbi:MAG: metal ABC transporter ATP-binding protein [Prevotellaceae bacterium]|jgi:zinc transport system ATP-binding protein|nr:metal ABC transporter ATP-binding protein [Prevotellaceae bacterium]